MSSASLSASSRDVSGKGAARTLRKQGQIPAVIYGRSRPPQSLSVNATDLERLLERIAAETTVIDLTVDGSVARTLIREIQRHPIRRDVLHVDFQELVAGEKVTVRIPILLQGIPEGVRTSGGILSQVMQELECHVDPAHMPSHIAVDVTNVSIGHSVHVGEITVPEGVEVLDDAEETVAVVAAPKAQEEAPVAATEAEVPTEPELIRKPKEEEEGGEEGEE